MYRHSIIFQIRNFMQLSSHETLYVRKYNGYEKEQYSKNIFHTFCDLSCYVILRVKQFNKTRQCYLIRISNCILTSRPTINDILNNNVLKDVLILNVFMFITNQQRQKYKQPMTKQSIIFHKNTCIYDMCPAMNSTTDLYFGWYLEILHRSTRQSVMYFVEFFIKFSQFVYIQILVTSFITCFFL